MPRGKRTEDVVMLRMALIGYLHERERLDSKIQELGARLKGKTTPAGKTKAAKATKTAGGKRSLSLAVRKRMAEAQKQRWAEHRKRQAAAAKQ
jgi:hypothetical protein